MLLVSYMCLQENYPVFTAEKDGLCHLVHLLHFTDKKVGQ